MQCARITLTTNTITVVHRMVYIPEDEHGAGIAEHIVRPGRDHAPGYENSEISCSLRKAH